MNANGGPLSGITVFEIASFVAGPLAGMSLSQLGASVIRIDPLGGAADRNRWPISDDGKSLYWNGLNKGKRSLEVDLRSEEGHNLVHQLISACAPGTAVVLTNIGGQPWLDGERLRRGCPDLVWVAIEGKHDGSPSVDYTANASMGFPLVTGPEGTSEPINHVLPAWDVACGLYAALGVSSAVRHRELTGEGSTIRIALEDVALATAGNLGFLAEAQFNSKPRGRIGNHLYGGFARDFECSDNKRVMVVALTKRHWRDLTRITGISEAVTALEGALRADFTVEATRYEHRELLAAMISPWFRERTYNEVVSALSTTTCLWSPYRSFQEVAENLRDTVGSNPIVATTDQPGLGRYYTAGSPLRFGQSTQIPPAPQLGEHTEEILSELLEIGTRKYLNLRALGVIR